MTSSQSSQNVEFEAAKFLHKLIQDSKDEPAKLATKLYVVCVLYFFFTMFELWVVIMFILIIFACFRYCNT